MSISFLEKILTVAHIVGLNQPSSWRASAGVVLGGVFGEH